MLQLKTNPLGFEITLPFGDDKAVRSFVPLTAAAAQGLILALLAQPGVAGALDPGLLENIAAEAHEQARADATFLKGVGVSQ